MTELVALPQPYPSSLPWVELLGCVEPSWNSGTSSTHFQGKLDGNTAQLLLRVQKGTSMTLATEIPEEFRPSSQLVFPAYSINYADPIMLILETTGWLRAHPAAAGLSDGTRQNVIMQAIYVRKVA